MELNIYITPPDGYEVVRIGIPNYGELFVNLDKIAADGNLIGDIHKKDTSDNINTCKLILKKKKKKKEVIIFESTGEFREPKEMEYFKISDGYNAIGYKPNHNVILGNKEIFKCTSKYTYED